MHGAAQPIGSNGDPNMKKLTLTLLVLALAVPLEAARDKNQSYFSYDDGGTVVRQSEDSREVEARVNLPVFPGDEVTTNRRGRAEIRLADGNVIAIDRASAVLFRSILDSYDGENEETVAELRYGKVMLFRTNEVRDAVRLDTPSATYVASREAIFSVETDTAGKDRIIVFEGSIEVRTPSRTTRLRRGDGASVDDRGLYSLASDDGDIGADDFERWFLRRAERYGKATSRYLDRSLAYYDDELGRHGSWITIGGYGNVWRPYVSAGWRPYYYGHWSRSRSGCLTWVSYEPWGWAPYHYGRWSHDPLHGWFWLPGSGYAPAWVYWWYGSGYIGWAPAGWYDLHRPYYDWAYRPYHRVGQDFGFGFYGRVRANEIDLRPWTFIDGSTIVSNRVDRAALTTDVIRGRLQRDNGGFATISGAPARFTRSEMKDPTAAINRRFAGGGIEGRGQGASAGGAPVDMTPFFRRDPDVSGTVRDRIVRSRPADSGVARGLAPTTGTGESTASRGGLAPIGGGSVAPIGGGALAPIGGGGDVNTIGSELGETTGRIRARTDVPRTDVATPVDRTGEGSRTERGDSGRIDRGGVATPAPSGNRGEVQSPTTWRARERVSRTPEPAPTAPRQQDATPRQDAQPSNDWRNRVAREAGERSTAGGSVDATPEAAPRSRSVAPKERDRSSDVPRRVIEGIVGGRNSSRDGAAREGSRDSAPPKQSVDRPKESAPPRSNDGGGSRDRGSSSRGEGGKIKRNN
jgi:hypothetical protein